MSNVKDLIYLFDFYGFIRRRAIELLKYIYLGTLLLYTNKQK